MKNVSYEFAVEFEKLLTKRADGLTVRDRVHFETKADANSWIEEIKKLDKGVSYLSFELKHCA